MFGTSITRPLNTYSEITIKGTKYKIHSIFDGEKSFQNLMEDLIVTKCILRKLTAGFAEQNGRNAELKRPECGLATAGANS